MKNGIYFDLDADVYHAQERMSNSGICKMLVSPPTFWASSWLNPNKKEVNEDTPAQILGRAYHTARFEPHLLNVLFVSKLDVSEYENLLTTGKEIEEKLGELGEPRTVKGERVLDKALRLKEAGYDGPILHIMEAQWERDRGDRVGIDAQYWQQMHRDIELFQNQPDINKHLTGGFAEVSVFWTDEHTGIDMKCRFDYLKPTSFTDLKTFDNPLGKNLEQCIQNAFQYNRYYVQAYLYWTVCELIRLKKVDKPEGVAWSSEQMALIDSIQSRTIPHECHYVFQEKSGISNLLAREVRILTPVAEAHPVNDAGVSHETSVEVAMRTRRLSALGQLAEMEVKRSLNLFNMYCETHEEGQPWTSLQPVGVIDDDCFSPYFLGLEK